MTAADELDDAAKFMLADAKWYGDQSLSVDDVFERSESLLMWHAKRLKRRAARLRRQAKR